jgi:hypothetical protein
VLDAVDRPLDAVDIFREDVAPTYATSRTSPATRALLDGIIADIINEDTDDIAILIADLSALACRYQAGFLSCLETIHQQAALIDRLRSNEIAQREITRAVYASAAAPDPHGVA